MRLNHYSKPWLAPGRTQPSAKSGVLSSELAALSQHRATFEHLAAPRLPRECFTPLWLWQEEPLPSSRASSSRGTRGVISQLPSTPAGIAPKGELQARQLCLDGRLWVEKQAQEVFVVKGGAETRWGQFGGYEVSVPFLLGSLCAR